MENKAKLGQSLYGSIANSYKDDYEKENGDKVIQNPGHVDEALWKKAKKISEESYGEIRWPFVMYMYEKLGGK